MSSVFIAGEKVNLCVPQSEDFEVWSSWFNNYKYTKFLEQGKFPNTVEQQFEFYRDAQNSNRFIAHIKSKDEQLLGVISLSEINYEKSSCQISIVCPVKSTAAPYAALEAMAITTEHAFIRLGLSRVWAGQAYPGLKKWSQHLELIGFKTEGVIRDGFVHGIEVTPAISISVTKKDFLSLIKRREGKLWAGEKKTRYMIAKLKNKKPLADKVHEILLDAHSEQDKDLCDIELAYAEV